MPDHEFHYKESFSVKAVETTGAGDSFVGGLAYGILNHMDLGSMLDFATCCSALTVQNTGAQAPCLISAPSWNFAADTQNEIQKVKQW